MSSSTSPKPSDETAPAPQTEDETRTHGTAGDAGKAEAAEPVKDTQEGTAEAKSAGSNARRPDAETGTADDDKLADTGDNAQPADEAAAAQDDEPDEDEPLDLRALFASDEPEFADPIDTFELARGAKPGARTNARDTAAAKAENDDADADLPFELPSDGAPAERAARSEPAMASGLGSLGGDGGHDGAASNALGSALGSAPGDPLADAVQSALRSVYGEDDNGDNHYMRDGSDSSASGPILQWAGAPVADRPDDSPARRDGFDPESAQPRHETAAIDEETTEAVLSYLYEIGGDETRENNAPAHSNDTDDDDLRADDAWAAAMQPRGAGTLSVRPMPYDDGAPGTMNTPASPDRSTAPAQPTAETFYPPVDVGAGDSEASGKLLGAAGLGLIGGIAAAGVAAVFVFNSFVTQQDPMGRETGLAQIDAGNPQTGGGEAAPQAGAPAQPSAANQTTAEPGRSAQAEAASEPGQTAAVTPDPNPPARLIAGPDTSGENIAALIGASAVSGRSDQTIPLALSVPEGDGDRFVRITGLPQGVKLSAGVDTGSGSWLLSAGRAQDLTLSAPDGFTGTFTLDAQLLGADARTPLSNAVSFQVEVTARQVAEAGETRTAAVGTETSPAANEPPASPLDRAQNLLRAGDVLAAREILRSETEEGSGEAALALGTSYDPRTFTGLTSPNASPDATEAFRWYQRASELGNPNGEMQISELKAWLLR